MSNTDVPTIVIPASRLRGSSRALLWTALAVVMAGLTWLIYKNIGTATGPDGKTVVRWAVGLAALPLALTALLVLVVAVRWILLMIWPGRLGFFFTGRQLEIRLGPFGTRDIPLPDLHIKYPFEYDDPEELGFEALLPPDHQIRNTVPHLTTADWPQPIHRLVLLFSGRDEPTLAGQLEPLIRRRRPDLFEDDEEGA